jgi:hypothetical protein
MASPSLTNQFPLIGEVRQQQLILKLASSAHGWRPFGLTNVDHEE